LRDFKNFDTVLEFDKSKSLLIDVVAHLKN